MRYPFVLKTLRALLVDGSMSSSDAILTVCAADHERRVFLEAGFKNVTISNLDDRFGDPDFGPYAWSYQNAQKLTFEANSFDHVFVSDGLHHCDSPHRALIEMLRVARKSVIVFESRDSLLMRLACRLRLASDYEIEAVVGSGLTHGGVNNSDVPNFVYRWTEREFEKTACAFWPYGPWRFRYFYGMNLPTERIAMQKSRIKGWLIRCMVPFARAAEAVAPRQCNSFCLIAVKPTRDALWPWLEQVEGQIRFNKNFAQRFNATTGSGYFDREGRNRT